MLRVGPTWQQNLDLLFFLKEKNLDLLCAARANMLLPGGAGPSCHCQEAPRARTVNGLQMQN